ncbi:MAG: hypothetical protein AVDCRST_MAG09-1190 [uncultured Sphingomonas sp.]|uniref:Lipoprotein n=2 Tax=uncultured Sphingomonas sp. TaxID=158754 RepID=A0A6J4SXW1_9SPHN|nr:MAG: hypothetical protein AVDCRST_MAG09-1190 [uncultured Sphingomonas sp.]
MFAFRGSSRSTAIAFLAAVTMSCTPAPTRSASAPLVELAGRTAGTPQRCVGIQQNEALRLGADRVVLYGRGRLVWVNRLSEDCAGMRPNDMLIVEPVGGSYCRGDRVRSMDPISRIPGPGCRLNDFVPFRR